MDNEAPSCAGCGATEFQDGRCAYCSIFAQYTDRPPHVVDALHCADVAAFELRLSNGNKALLSYHLVRKLLPGGKLR